MATTSYNGSWGDSYSLNTTRTCYLSGGGGASGIINSVTVDLIFSTNAYSPHYYLTITLLTNSGNIEIEDEVKMTSDDYSFASRSFTFSNVSLSQANSITGISIKCTGASSSSGSASKVFVKSSVSVVVDYTIPSKLATPTISTGTTMTTDSTVAISWAASWNTTANTLTAYELQYADSSNGSSFSATHTAQVHAAFRPPCQRLKVGANSASVRLAAPEATTIPIGANQVQFVELLCRQRRAALPFRRRYGTAETSRFRGLLRL